MSPARQFCGRQTSVQFPGTDSYEGNQFLGFIPCVVGEILHYGCRLRQVVDMRRPHSGARGTTNFRLNHTRIHLKRVSAHDIIMYFLLLLTFSPCLHLALFSIPDQFFGRITYFMSSGLCINTTVLPLLQHHTSGESVSYKPQRAISLDSARLLSQKRYLHAVQDLFQFTGLALSY